MDNMLKKLEEYLYKLLSKRKSGVDDYSCSSFSKNIDEIFQNPVKNAFLVKTLGTQLEKFERKSNLSPKDVCKYTGIPNGLYDRMKNQMSSFDSFDKKTICLLIICFGLTEKASKTLLGTTHILLQPTKYSFDAAFEFFVKEWYYTSNTQKNMNDFYKCCEFAEDYYSHN